MKAEDYAGLFRVKHYVKNFLLFVPLFTQSDVLNKRTLLSFALAFAAFCALSTAVYMINDLLDCEKDRLHPVKRERPIASGRISKTGSLGIVTVFLALTAAFGLLTDHIASANGMLILVGYLTLNLLYSSFAKNLTGLEMLFIPAGFLLRLLYGYQLLTARPDLLLVLFVFTAALYFVLHKRSAEIRIYGEQARSVLARYDDRLLRLASLLCLAGSLLLFAALQWVGKVFPGSLLQRIGSLVLLCALFARFEWLAARSSAENAVDLALADRFMCLMGIAFPFTLADYSYLFSSLHRI